MKKKKEEKEKEKKKKKVGDRWRWRWWCWRENTIRSSTIPNYLLYYLVEWFNRTLFWTSPVRARLPDFSDTLVISRALGLLIFWFNQPVRLSLIFNDVTKNRARSKVFLGISR